MSVIQLNQTAEALGPETVALAASAFETAWSTLEKGFRSEIQALGSDLTRSIMARRIVSTIGQGERDLTRLQQDALAYMKLKSWTS